MASSGSSLLFASTIPNATGDKPPHLLYERTRGRFAPKGPGGQHLLFSPALTFPPRVLILPSSGYRITYLFSHVDSGRTTCACRYRYAAAWVRYPPALVSCLDDNRVFAGLSSGHGLYAARFQHANLRYAARTCCAQRLLPGAAPSRLTFSLAMPARKLLERASLPLACLLHRHPTTGRNLPSAPAVVWRILPLPLTPHFNSISIHLDVRTGLTHGIGHSLCTAAGVDICQQADGGNTRIFTHAA